MAGIGRRIRARANPGTGSNVDYPSLRFWVSDALRGRGTRICCPHGCNDQTVLPSESSPARGYSFFGERVTDGPGKKAPRRPPVYLRRFANRGDRLFVLDKPSGRVFSAHIRDVAHENGFHDVNDPSTPGLTGSQVEADLARIENMFAQTSAEALRELRFVG